MALESAWTAVKGGKYREASSVLPAKAPHWEDTGLKQLYKDPPHGGRVSTEAIREEDRKITQGKGQHHKAPWAKITEKKRETATITEEAYHLSSETHILRCRLKVMVHMYTHSHQHLLSQIQTQPGHRIA